MMKRLKPYVTLLLSSTTIFGLASCHKTDEENLVLGKDLVLTAMELQKAEADNSFAFELFAQATKELKDEENALLSPLSVGMALAMTNNGAGGATREAIAKALKFEGFTTEEINAYYQKLIRDLPALDPKTALNIANSVWYRKDFTVLPDFLDVSRALYEAEVAALDFADPNAPDVINDWVSKKTQGNIPTIIDGPIMPNIMMYLINAIYFKGDWEQRFDKSATKKQPFTRVGNSPLQTDFMQVEHTFNLSITDDVEAIELPYGNKKYSMVVLKPRDDQNPRQVIEKLLETNSWSTLVSGFQPRTARLALPKFKFSYDNELKDELTGIGMGIAFHEGAADFSGISERKLVINRVLHKTFVDVNEEGTEAAAVTAVEMRTYSSGPSPVYTFNVDRPFLFAIREMNTGLILFIGQVMTLLS